MPVETGEWVGDFDTANPTNGDAKKYGDDHLRLIKEWVQNSFAGWDGLVLAYATEAAGATVNDYVLTLAPTPSGYTTGVVVFIATHTNTSAATLAVNALGAKDIKTLEGTALAAGNIQSGSICAAFYNGTEFRIISANGRALLTGGVYTGTHDFTGATITVPAPASGSAPVTRDYMDAVVIAAGNLPDPTAHSGELLSSDGVSGAWVTKINADVMKFRDGSDDSKLLVYDLSGMSTATTKTLLFNDYAFNFTDPAAPTKKAHLVLSAITAGQDRAWTAVDRDIILDTPALRWLESLTASTSATLDFTAFNSALYSDYIIILSGMDLAATNADLLLQLTIGGTLRTANYYYHTNISTHTAATYAGLNGSNVGSILLADDLSNKPNTLPNLSMHIHIFNAGNTAKYPLVKWSGVSSMSGAASFKEASGVGGNSNIGAITTARLLASSGTIKDGTGHLYGIRRS